MGISTNVHGVTGFKARARIHEGFVSLDIGARMKRSYSDCTEYADTSYFLPPALANKALRIAAAINEIMAGNDSADAPLVEAIASDTFTPLGEVAATVVAGLTPEADVAETLAAE